MAGRAINNNVPFMILLIVFLRKNYKTTWVESFTNDLMLVIQLNLPKICMLMCLKSIFQMSKK